MYAVIASGGKQYRVTQGERIKLERLPAEAGSTVEFDKVLMIADGDSINIGNPYISGMKVSASVVEHGRGKKINIIKFKRRKNSIKRMGHRQDYTEVQIESIAGKAAEKKQTTAKVETKTAEKKAKAAEDTAQPDQSE